MELISFWRQKSYRIIGNALEDLGNYEGAIEVYEAMQAVDLLERCYSRMACSQTSLQDQFKAYSNYARFLEEHGRWQKALEIYQMVIDKFINMPKQLSTIKERAKECIEHTMSDKLKDYLNDLAKDSKI